MNHRVDRKGFVKADFLSSSGIRDRRGGGGGFNEIDLPFSAFSSAPPVAISASVDRYRSFRL